MSIPKITAPGIPSAYAVGKPKKQPQEAEFEKNIKQTSVPKKTGYIVYTKTDDMLYSGGNGSGLSYYLKYAEESTEEDPVVIAKGVDENGEEFEQKIHINKISPRHATLVEMRALEAHLGVEKNGGFSSLPLAPGLGEMGLNDRADFLNMFQNTIADMTLLKQRQAASYYQYSMQMYQDFLLSKTWHLSRN